MRDLQVLELSRMWRAFLSLSFASPFQIFYNSSNPRVFSAEKIQSHVTRRTFMILHKALLISILNRANFESNIVLTGLTLQQRKDLGLFSVKEK